MMPNIPRNPPPAAIKPDMLVVDAEGKPVIQDGKQITAGQYFQGLPQQTPPSGGETISQVNKTLARWSQSNPVGALITRHSEWGAKHPFANKMLAPAKLVGILLGIGAYAAGSVVFGLGVAGYQGLRGANQLKNKLLAKLGSGTPQQSAPATAADAPAQRPPQK